MPSQSNQANLIQLLRRIPPKWALAIVGVVLLYWLGQPVLNRTFGWNLPTIAAMLGENQAPPKVDLGSDRGTPSDIELADRSPSTSPNNQPRNPSPPAPFPKDGDRAASAKKDVPKTLDSKPNSAPKTNFQAKPTDVAKPTSAPKRKDGAEADSVATPKKQDSKNGDFLTEVGQDRFRSPAGLLYTRGSEEGHRLKHIAKHLEDQPARPGSHGVFDGDLNQALRWIDEAYQKAKKGDRSARKYEQDDDSTKYEVTFDKPIGYVGGSDGKRKGNPPAKRLRLIVRGQDVITAFPF